MTGVGSLLFNKWWKGIMHSLNTKFFVCPYKNQMCFNFPISIVLSNKSDEELEYWLSQARRNAWGQWGFIPN